MAEQKKTLIRLEPPFQAPHDVYFGLTMLNSEQHGPFRISALGVGFGSHDNPGFVPWAQVSGVVGWEPPAPKPYAPGEPPPGLESGAAREARQQGKFKP